MDAEAQKKFAEIQERLAEADRDGIEVGEFYEIAHDHYDEDVGFLIGELAKALKAEARVEVLETALTQLCNAVDEVDNNARYVPDGPFENGGHHTVEDLGPLRSATEEGRAALRGS